MWQPCELLYTCYGRHVRVAGRTQFITGPSTVGTGTGAVPAMKPEATAILFYVYDCSLISITLIHCGFVVQRVHATCSALFKILTDAARRAVRLR